METFGWVRGLRFHCLCFLLSGSPGQGKAWGVTRELWVGISPLWSPWLLAVGSMLSPLTPRGMTRKDSSWWALPASLCFTPNPSSQVPAPGRGSPEQSPVRWEGSWPRGEACWLPGSSLSVPAAPAQRTGGVAGPLSALRGEHPERLPSLPPSLSFGMSEEVQAGECTGK